MLRIIITSDKPGEGKTEASLKIFNLLLKDNDVEVFCVMNGQILKRVKGTNENPFANIQIFDIANDISKGYSFVLSRQDINAIEKLRSPATS